MRTRGFTLLELLVVLVILGLAAAVVPMAWRVPDAASTDSWPEVLTTARRLALGRSQPVELRTDHEGRWAIVTSGQGDTLRVGRLPAGDRGPADVVIRVDALGMCRPPHGIEGEPPFDMTACRQAASGDAGGVGGVAS